MNPPTRTPEGQPQRCPVCGNRVVIEPSQPVGDAPCPHCGCLLWFTDLGGKDRIHAFHKLTISDRSICTKAQAISSILDHLVEARALDHVDQKGVLAALLKREDLGSTGIGRGIAIPNAKYPGLDRVVGAIADFPAGVEFDSLDAQPVGRLCLFVSPKELPGDHLRVLQALTQWLRGE